MNEVENMKKIIALIDVEKTENAYLKMNEVINKNNNLMKLRGCIEVPYDTTVEEISDIIVQNRSKKIEEDYAQTFEELS